jgi:phosphoglycerate dehydrogenase-like enzyme
VTNTTRGLYGPKVLDKLKPDAILINTARGQIVDEKAIKERLKDGRLEWRRSTPSSAADRGRRFPTCRT